MGHDESPPPSGPAPPHPRECLDRNVRPEEGGGGGEPTQRLDGVVVGGEGMGRKSEKFILRSNDAIPAASPSQ